MTRAAAAPDVIEAVEVCLAAGVLYHRNRVPTAVYITPRRARRSRARWPAAASNSTSKAIRGPN
jgi:hypothetical protein